MAFSISDISYSSKYLKKNSGLKRSLAKVEEISLYARLRMFLNFLKSFVK